MATLPQILKMLDRDDALELGDPPSVWPIAEPSDPIFELDWGRLFPTRVVDRGVEDWELYGDDDWGLSPDLLDRLAGDVIAPVDDVAFGRPGWDRCAWYQPIHFHGPGWGIFIYDDCITDVARHLYDRLSRPPLTVGLAKALLRAGFATLFLHEQYHHKTESLGLRLHVVEQASRYVPYFRTVYASAVGTDDLLEEGLANADAFLRLDTAPYTTWLGPTLKRLTRSYLKASFRASPPAYGLASGLLDREPFDRAEELFKAQVQEASLTPARPVDDFAIATRLNQSMFAVNQNIWTVASRGATPLMPIRPGASVPLSRVDLEKALVREGFTYRSDRGKGSHRVYQRDGSPIIVLAHGKELSPVVLRNTAKALGFRNAQELVESVRR